MATARKQLTVSSGIAGLDEILRGGLPASNLYIVQGDPGAGKTTAALQFLRAGVEAGERCIYVSLSQSASELEAITCRTAGHLTGSGSKSSPRPNR
jgi:circadian clock protein KaiC